MLSKKVEYTVDDFYFFKIGPMWRYFKSEHPAFWLICGYLFFEYFRPQALYPAIAILPWSQVLLLGSLAFSFFDQKSRLSWTTAHTLIVLYTVQIYMSFIFAYDVSWSKYYISNFYPWIIIFFVTTYIVTTPERFYLLLMVFFVCTLKLAIGTALIWARRGFAFTPWGIMGPQGFFQNSGELAIQMLIMFSLSIYLYKAFKGSNISLKERLILLVSVVTPIMTVLGASSRGSQLALPILILLVFGKKILNIKNILILVFALASIWAVLPDAQKDRFSSMGSDGTSAQRLAYWTRGIEMIAEHPIMGVGYYNFIPYFTDFYSEDIGFRNREGELVAELPHNIIIQIGTDAGITAILIFLMLVVHLSRSKLNDSDTTLKFIEKGLALGVVGFFIAGQFVTVTYYPFIWIAAALITSLRSSVRIDKNAKSARSAILVATRERTTEN